MNPDSTLQGMCPQCPEARGSVLHTTTPITSHWEPISSGWHSSLCRISICKLSHPFFFMNHTQNNWPVPYQFLGPPLQWCKPILKGAKKVEPDQISLMRPLIGRIDVVRSNLGELKMNFEYALHFIIYSTTLRASMQRHFPWCNS